MGDLASCMKSAGHILKASQIGGESNFREIQSDAFLTADKPVN